MVDKKALHTREVFLDREVLMKRMPEVTAGFEDQGDKEKVALVWDGCCRDLKVGKATECMWRKRFCAPE